LPSFLGASTVSSSSRFVVEGVFRESGVFHSFKVVDPVLFAFESHVLFFVYVILNLIALLNILNITENFKMFQILM
jgi:hypothetical protein